VELYASGECAITESHRTGLSRGGLCPTDYLYPIRKELAAKFLYDVQALGKFFQAQQAIKHRVVVTHAPRRVPDTVQGPTSTSDQA
jgi:hypothetical protein